jgi:hypothetical protein
LFYPAAPPCTIRDLEINYPPARRLFHEKKFTKMKEGTQAINSGGRAVSGSKNKKVARIGMQATY